MVAIFLGMGRTDEIAHGEARGRARDFLAKAEADAVYAAFIARVAAINDAEAIKRGDPPGTIRLGSGRLVRSRPAD